MTASVWNRPTVSEDVKDRLAERQSRAAVALVRMGKAEEVWPLLRHSADPQGRSFIISWLNPLGADQKPIVAELGRIDATAKPAACPRAASNGLDPVRRRDLDSQGADSGIGRIRSGGPVPRRERVTHRQTTHVYRDDPDAGIHGAAEWILRRWGQENKLKEMDAQLMKIKNWGNRRWYVNGQGQTFAVIEGPVEFHTGSPPNEPDRDPDEVAHRWIIPRRFAVATKEVTVEQYRAIRQKDAKSRSVGRSSQS